MAGRRSVCAGLEPCPPRPTPTTPTVVAIHIAPATRLAMKSVPSVEAEAGKGLVGDRYHGTRHRHVTVQSAADLAEAAAELGCAGRRRRPPGATSPSPTAPSRRSPASACAIGDVELEVVRIAAPCKLLDDVIGDGARHALRRRAGTVFRVLSSGTITVGDPVDLAPTD